MDNVAGHWPTRNRFKDLIQSFLKLSLNPWCLFLGLLLLNAIMRPYSDLIHDARLYAVQVLNRANFGLYGDDLYLKFGSQDRFSLFSKFVSPFVQPFGIRSTFFFFYLVSSSFLLFSAQRFVSRIVRWKSVAALSLIYIAVNPVPFGGLDVFHLNENFLTPRLAAIGFVLFAMTHLARQQIGYSLLCLFPAFLLHPVMAFSGFLVWLYFTLTTFLSGRQIGLLFAAGLTPLLAIILHPPWGDAVLGEMDATWKQNVQVSNHYAFLQEWTLTDWIKIGTAFAITLTSRNTLRLNESTKRLLDGIVTVATLGIIGGLIAPWLPYALPLQGQPYRALWLLQFIQIPLGAALLRAAWADSKPHATSRVILLGSCFAAGAMTLVQTLSSFSMLWVLRSRKQLAEKTNGNLPTNQRILFFVAAILLTIPLLAPLIAHWDQIKNVPSPIDLLRFVPPTLGPLYTLLASVLMITWMFWQTGGGRLFCTTATVGCLSLQALFFTGPQWAQSTHWVARHEHHLTELNGFLDQRFKDSDRLPTLYWPQIGLDDIWVTLGSKCFFSKQQTAGNMFNRGTAVEGQRRATLVSPFELAELKRNGKTINRNDWTTRSLFALYGSDFDVEPSWHALDELCQEDVDILVIRQNFDNLHSIQIGDLFIYECEKIRDAVHQRVTNRSQHTTIPVTSQPSVTKSNQKKKTRSPHPVESM